MLIDHKVAAVVEDQHQMKIKAEHPEGDHCARELPRPRCYLTRTADELSNRDQMMIERPRNRPCS